MKYPTDIQFPDFTDIGYLVHKKYPEATRIKNIMKSISAANLGEEGQKKNKAYLKKVEDYRSELFRKLPEEISALCAVEKKKEEEAAKLKAEKEEKERFFHQPDAKANFDHWSRAKYWTLDEAIALSFDKDPEVVGWNRMISYIEVSPFGKDYYRRHNLASRAKDWTELYDPVLPGLFIAWAKRLDIPFPNELEKLVIARGGNVADWKTNYDALEKKYEEARKESIKQLDKGLQMIELLQGQVAELSREKAEISASLKEAIGKLKEKPLQAKERDSALKLIIGMAVDGYGYNPKSTRSAVPKELSDHLSAHGISLDDDTIRKWLKEAAALLPPNPDEI